MKYNFIIIFILNQLLYAAPVWCSSLVVQNHRQVLLGPQRTVALRVASAYQTMSTRSILVVAEIVPVHLMARGRCELRRLQNNDTVNTRQLVDNNVWGWWQQEWEEKASTGAWTKRLIPDVKSWTSRTHRASGFYMTQFLTGHGCF